MYNLTYFNWKIYKKPWSIWYTILIGPLHYNFPPLRIPGARAPGSIQRIVFIVKRVKLNPLFQSINLSLLRNFWKEGSSYPLVVSHFRGSQNYDKSSLQTRQNANMCLSVSFHWKAVWEQRPRTLWLHSSFCKTARGNSRQGFSTHSNHKCMLIFTNDLFLFTIFRHLSYTVWPN